ncbi:hypothetical protein FRC10_011079, partial [Ceratobasidium sp. 414]
MSIPTSPTTPSRPSWLRVTPSGLRANKTSRSVLATIDEAALAVAPRARATVPACFSGTFATPARMAARAGDDGRYAAYTAPYTPISPLRPASCPSPTTPRQTSQVLPDDVDSDDSANGVGVFGFRAVPRDEPASAPGRIADSALPSLPTSSRHTVSTGESGVQIVTARPFRIHTARARSHSIEAIKGLQLLSPESPSHSFSHPRPPPLDLSRAPLTPGPSPRPYHPLRSLCSPSTPGTPASASPLLPPLRSISPLVVPTSPSPAPSPSSAPSVPPSPSPSTPVSALPPRRRIPGPSAIVKDFAALLEHIHEGEIESHCSAGISGSGLRTASSASVPAHRSGLAIVSLPPPPRPRNRALVRPAPHPFANPSVSLPLGNSNLAGPSLNFTPRTPASSEHAFGSPPALAPAPHSRNFSARRQSGSGPVPLTPAAISLPPSSTTYRFPQSPHSSFLNTPHVSRPSSPRSPTCQSSFLPSCKSTIDSVAIKDRPRHSDSTDFVHHVSPLSFSEFNLPYSPQRASGFSFSSGLSGLSARSATEAESIPIDLHGWPAHLDFGLAPLSPRSSLLREVGVEVDVHLPEPECGDESDECSSYATTEEGSKDDKSVKTFRERARSLGAAVSSLNKVDRVLGKGTARAFLSGVHAHVPHLSLSSMSSESNAQPLPGSDSADHSFLPHTGPQVSFIGLGRKLSKKAVEPNMARRRSEDVARVPSGGLMARMDRFMGRTPSPSMRTKELEDESDVAPPPPLVAYKPLHGRKHSSSDPSAGIIRPRPSDRPATTNMRSAAERADLVKKTRKIQQLLGDVPSEDACESTFYRLSRAAKSEDFAEEETLITPLRVGGRRHSNPGSFADVLVSADPAEAEGGVTVGRVPSQNRNQVKRGFHRPTASASSVLSALPLLPPMAPVSPALISPDSYGLLSPGFSVGTTSTTDEEAALGLVSPKSTTEMPEVAVESDSEKPGLEDALDDLALADEKTDVEDEVALARRAKRAKVAKLHRYLGSRVPAHLVLGLDESWDYEAGLPEARSEDEAVVKGGPSLLALGGVGVRKKMRRSSEGDGECEEIGDLSVMSSEEKARAVRRKAKMEKMFGERPPQKLYQPHASGDTPTLENLSEESEGGGGGWEQGGGDHYKTYRASFNSLAYFVNNADRDSLERLYNIVSAQPEGSTEEGEEGTEEGKPMRDQFAARRKRAAKLSKFFGVSYRDLFGAVLDILESDVREDKEEGSLSAAETQVLLMKLKKLKAKGEGISA